MIITTSTKYNYAEDIQWLSDYIHFRCQAEFSLNDITTQTPQPPVGISAYEMGGSYGQLMQPFTDAERLILLMAFANQAYPSVWDVFAAKTLSLSGNQVDLRSFGLVYLSEAPYLQATIGTALFLLAGNNAAQQREVWQLFLPQSPLRTLSVLDLPDAETLPTASTTLRLQSQYAYPLLTGEPYQPQYSSGFPATLLTTRKNWNNLITDEKTATLIAQARKWVAHYDKICQQPGIAQANGYRLLLSGPPGTGKTLTAALLGQEAGKPLYRIDISSIVDKYVGETSKRLCQVFDLAEQHDWILFFDEGDALFGKRSNDGGSNERYANQEVSYLLYKLEEYQGMIFLATNHKNAIDSAFERRFDSLIEFHKPDEYTRRQLWQHFFEQPGTLQLDLRIHQNNWRELAEKAPVSAAWIEKFYAYCVMQTTAKRESYISAEDMRQYLHWFGWERGYFENKTRNLFLKEAMV